MRRTSTPRSRQWLAAHPRFHLHFTPTYASWLNQVERWFGLLSQRAIKRGSFRSVADLVRKIQAFIDSYNASATPFVWGRHGPVDHRQGGAHSDAHFRDSTLVLRHD